MKSALIAATLLLLLLTPAGANGALSDKQTSYRVVAGKKAAVYRYNDYLASATAQRANLTAFLNCIIEESNASAIQVNALPEETKIYAGLAVQNNLSQRSFTLMTAKKHKEINALFKNRYRALIAKGAKRKIALALLAHARYIEGLRELPAFSVCLVLREWRLGGWDNTILQNKLIPYVQVVLLSSKIDQSKKQLAQARNIMSNTPGVLPAALDYFESPISFQAIESLVSPMP